MPRYFNQGLNLNYNAGRPIAQIARVYLGMHFQFSEFGHIEDVATGQCWNQTRISTEVASRAEALSVAGVAPGTTVMVTHSGSARFFADLFAVWRLDCVAACIDPTLTANEIKTLVEFVQPSAIIVDEVTPAIRTDVPIVRLTPAMRSTAPVPDLVDDLERPALILFTSGTTGTPKGVVLSFRALLRRFALNGAAMGAASRMRTLVTLPTSFGHGLIGNALTPLLSGGDIVLYPRGMPLARDLGRIVDEFRIGFLSSVPSLWRMSLKFSDAPGQNSLARVHVGSAPLAADLWYDIAKWCRADVVNCYGITELANWVAGASSRVEGISDGLVGKPWGGEAAIKDRAGNIRGAGEGELLVKSPSAMSGYLRRPDLTAAAFSDGWYNTGDTGCIDDRGLVKLTGRIKEEINRAGFKVQPSEIDLLLEQYPAVSEACVFAIPDTISGEIVAAAVQVKQGEKIDTEALRRWCATRLRREAIPERWFVVDRVPRTDRGKVNRDAVRQMLIGDPR